MFAALAAGVFAAPLMAQNAIVSLQSAVFIERLGHTGDGRVVRGIEPAKTFKRGDRVILMVEWAAKPSAKGFEVTSAIPAAIAYQDTSSDTMQVSVDGGKHWGMLGALKTGGHYASPEEVTHLRWQVSALDARRGNGRMTYSAIVR
jgi:hypothetical protein